MSDRKQGSQIHIHRKKIKSLKGALNKVHKVIVVCGRGTISDHRVLLSALTKPMPLYKSLMQTVKA